MQTRFNAPVAAHERADACRIGDLGAQIDDPEGRFVPGIFPVEVRDVAINAKYLVRMRSRNRLGDRCGIAWDPSIPLESIGQHSHS